VQPAKFPRPRSQRARGTAIDRFEFARFWRSCLADLRALSDRQHLRRVVRREVRRQAKASLRHVLKIAGAQVSILAVVWWLSESKQTQAIQLVDSAVVWLLLLWNGYMVLFDAWPAVRQSQSWTSGVRRLVLRHVLGTSLLRALFSAELVLLAIIILVAMMLGSYIGWRIELIRPWLRLLR
jgi:hypothetical protein